MSAAGRMGFVQNLRNALDAGQTRQVEALCAELVEGLRGPSPSNTAEDAETILQLLRRKRAFAHMREVAEAFLRAGRDTPMIRRQYAQALIELKELPEAIAILDRLIAETPKGSAENDEAYGLRGRAYKQLYVDADKADPGALLAAIRSYLPIYETPARPYWHGINVVALLHRALLDRVAVEEFSGRDAAKIAEEIRVTIEAKELRQAVDMWECGTAMESCVALGLITGKDYSREALKWARCYIRFPTADAFELGSTLRQLTQVWQLDASSELGRLLLPVLQSALLWREGGHLEIHPRDLHTGALTALADGQYQAYLGPDATVTLRWFKTAIERCRGVSRIETKAGVAKGTGFMLRGKDLRKEYGDEFLVMTNSHVVSPDPEAEAQAHPQDPPPLAPEEALIVFEEVLDDGTVVTRHHAVKEKVAWNSPRAALDTTLLRLQSPPVGIPPWTVKKVIPGRGAPRRIYIIGYPEGRMGLSIHDNLFLGYEEPRLYYRTPTNDGSSGSPVFDGEWNLIGIHHVGKVQFTRPGDAGSAVLANGGISLKAIAAALPEMLPEE